MDNSFSKEKRIKRKREISSLFKEGKRWNGVYGKIIYRKNRETYDRLAVLVYKKLGSAVFRNRLKRLVREVFRTSRNKTSPFFDILFCPKKITPIEQKNFQKEYRTWRDNIKVY